MRLIDTEYLEFAPQHFEVPDQGSRYASPPYAVLSHRWFSQGEVDFTNFATGKGPESGLNKIRGFCQIAREKQLRYGWVDTVCINKSSSAELTESINGMWRLYQYSSLCIVYLHDVSISTFYNSFEENDPYLGSRARERSVPRDRSTLRVENHPFRSRSDPGEGYNNAGGRGIFHESEWFRRGWTLQELLAPPHVEFYDRDWYYLGSRRTLEQYIERATGIRNINNPSTLRDASIAQRMSWAASRETSRDEDKAYCLIGLFDVSLPILYGEGGLRAFYRLQLEIIKEYDDESVFAWDQSDEIISGMLAPSPKDFAYSFDVVQHKTFGHNRPYSMTNKGLTFHCFAKKMKIRTKSPEKSIFKRWFDYRAARLIYEVPLNCRRQGLENLAITLVGFKNEPGVCREGSLKPTKLNSSDIKTFDDYYDWFHDFHVPQDATWALTPWNAYIKGKHGPETFDNLEAKLLANHMKREMEANASDIAYSAAAQTFKNLTKN